MLPDGKILILGGIGGDGLVVDTAEVYDPESKTSELLDPARPRSSILDPQSSGFLTPRVYHTATLLTDGLVLIAGGVSNGGEALKTAELWDFRAKRAVGRLKLRAVRFNHTATLLPAGDVLLSHGNDKDNKPLANGESFNPTRNRLKKINAAMLRELLDVQSEPGNPRLAGSLPVDGGIGVAPDALLALRFSTQRRAETVNAQTLRLNGPYGAVDAKIVPAERGMLAFVTPAGPLLPGVTYALSIDGAAGHTSPPITSAVVTFTIAACPSLKAPTLMKKPGYLMRTTAMATGGLIARIAVGARSSPCKPRRASLRSAANA